jgi:hypothetical protein
MKKLWLLLMVIPLQLIHAQEVKHAPTVEQCRADQRLWLAKLEQDPPRSGTANVSYNELNAWTIEMMDCESVDPASAKGYYNTLGEATSEQALRAEGFLHRHNLYGQFLAEDAQGKR